MKETLDQMIGSGLVTGRRRIQISTETHYGADRPPALVFGVASRVDAPPPTGRPVAMSAIRRCVRAPPDDPAPSPHALGRRGSPSLLPCFPGRRSRSAAGRASTAIEREPPAPKSVRFGAGALAHRFGYPSLAALAARGEFARLGASPRNPLAPSLDHRSDHARLALCGPRTGRSAAMHPATTVLHCPTIAKDAAGDSDAVLADPEMVLDPRVAALTE